MGIAFIVVVLMIVGLMAIGLVRGETRGKRDDRE